MTDDLKIGDLVSVEGEILDPDNPSLTVGVGYYLRSRMLFVGLRPETIKKIGEASPKVGERVIWAYSPEAVGELVAIKGNVGFVDWDPFDGFRQPARRPLAELKRAEGSA